MNYHNKNVLSIRHHSLVFGKQTYIMGIINVTPDSFSKDGITNTQAAIASALDKIKQGAFIIDIGGQSTRPGYTAIDEETEANRVIPVVKGIRAASDVIISVDTFSPTVARQAVLNGADIINSIWGINRAMLDLISQTRTPVVIMHNKDEAVYPDGVVQEVKTSLKKQAETALKAGLTKDQIILDPGIGFGKTAEHNMEILTNFSEIVELGFPTLLGTSRKSTIGKLIDKTVEERVFGTAASVAFAITRGVDIVRVHDIKEISDVVKVSDALVRRWRPENWN